MIPVIAGVPDIPPPTPRVTYKRLSCCIDRVVHCWCATDGRAFAYFSHQIQAIECAMVRHWPTVVDLITEKAMNQREIYEKWNAHQRSVGGTNGIDRNHTGQ